MFKKSYRFEFVNELRENPVKEEVGVFQLFLRSMTSYSVVMYVGIGIICTIMFEWTFKYISPQLSTFALSIYV